MSRTKNAPTSSKIVLSANERTALDTFMAAKRKWYTAKRIASLSALSVAQVTKAFDRFVSLDLMWLSDYKAGGTDNRYAMSDEGVELHETLTNGRKPKAPKAVEQDEAEDGEDDEQTPAQIAAEKALADARKALKRAEKLAAKAAA